jgi:hypothetical protein
MCIASIHYTLVVRCMAPEPQEPENMAIGTHSRGNHADCFTWIFAFAIPEYKKTEYVKDPAPDPRLRQTGGFIKDIDWTRFRMLALGLFKPTDWRVWDQKRYRHDHLLNCHVKLYYHVNSERHWEECDFDLWKHIVKEQRFRHRLGLPRRLMNLLLESL